MKQELEFGVIVPTFKRPRPLQRFVSNLSQQTYPHWKAFIVHDGPTAQLTHSNDERIFFKSLQKRTCDSGISPRLMAIEESRKHTPDYLVFWDDDNRAEPNALKVISKALAGKNFPDVLVIPIRFRGKTLPPPDWRPGHRGLRNVDTGNFVIRTELAESLYEEIRLRGVKAAEDAALYELMEERGLEVVLATDIPPQLLYDGNRSLSLILERFGLSNSILYWLNIRRLKWALQLWGERNFSLSKLIAKIINIRTIVASHKVS